MDDNLEIEMRTLLHSSATNAAKVGAEPVVAPRYVMSGMAGFLPNIPSRKRAFERLHQGLQLQVGRIATTLVECGGHQATH